MAKDYLGIDIKLNDTVVFITTNYRDFSKGIVTKIGEHKVTIKMLNGKLTHRHFYDVIVFVESKK